MSAIPLDLPDDLAERLRPLPDHLPSPEETLALHPAPALESRVKDLLEKSRTVGLSQAEEDEWQRYEYIEHLVRLAKAKAALKLRPR